jgi:hypothetical protein
MDTSLRGRAPLQFRRAGSTGLFDQRTRVEYRSPIVAGGTGPTGLATKGEDNPDVDLDLLKFSRLSQSPNDAAAIRFRLELLTDYVKSHYKVK